MFSVAIDQREFLVYEGYTNYGRAVWPAPVLSIATIITAPADIEKLPQTHDLITKFVFREDSFDPVTRVRRGRMYHWAAGQSQPQGWHVQPHPAYNEQLASAQNVYGGWIDKNLFGFAAWPAFRELGGRATRSLIALGTKDAYTLWRIVDIERIVTGEDLLTLRAQSPLGVLPELNVQAIPDGGRAKVLELVEKLASSAHRADAESVVDLSRATAQWCLGVWLADRRGYPGFMGKDLGHLIAELEHREKDVAALIARFHSRGKPNEQHTYQSRPISSEDGDFCLSSIALLLRELGWAAGK